MTASTSANARQSHLKRLLATGYLGLALGFDRRWRVHLQPSAIAYFKRRGGLFAAFVDLREIESSAAGVPGRTT